MNIPSGEVPPYEPPTWIKWAGIEARLNKVDGTSFTGYKYVILTLSDDESLPRLKAVTNNFFIALCYKVKGIFDNNQIMLKGTDNNTIKHKFIELEDHAKSKVTKIRALRQQIQTDKNWHPEEQEQYSEFVKKLRKADKTFASSPEKALKEFEAIKEKLVAWNKKNHRDVFPGVEKMDFTTALAQLKSDNETADDKIRLAKQREDKDWEPQEKREYDRFVKNLKKAEERLKSSPKEALQDFERIKKELIGWNTEWGRDVFLGLAKMDLRAALAKVDTDAKAAAEKSLANQQKVDQEWSPKDQKRESKMVQLLLEANKMSDPEEALKFFEKIKKSQLRWNKDWHRNVFPGLENMNLKEAIDQARNSKFWLE